MRRIKILRKNPKGLHLGFEPIVLSCFNGNQDCFSFLIELCTIHTGQYESLNDDSIGKIASQHIVGHKTKKWESRKNVWKSGGATIICWATDLAKFGGAISGDDRPDWISATLKEIKGMVLLNLLNSI